MHTITFWLTFDNLSPAVTLKIKSRSLKPNQLFILSKCYIHANVVKMHSPVHEISCKQESVTLKPTPTLTTTPTPTPKPVLTPTPTGSAPKTVCPPPLRWGDIMINRSVCPSLTSVFKTSGRKTFFIISGSQNH